MNTEKDDDNVFYFTMEDLFHIITLIGESNESIDSLNQFFIGKSMGERRIYFFGEPKYSYLLYKDTSHNNVMVKLKRVGGKWVEIGKKVKNGKVIELDQPKCN
ncbi:hypothetical protein [Virgibacillus tibetensis]|uniref:hypothetical protein n=1 Tax=Virgibacillus tibetensis TaxID=3042313 RepID=UPI002E197A54